METVLEPDYAEPSYNGNVVAESNELATLDQYWRERRTRYEENLERYKVHAEDPAAEREWQSFCSGGIGFLQKYGKKAVASLGAPLRHLWTNGSGIRDYNVRVSPGEIVPSGECPECGALCHPM